MKSRAGWRRLTHDPSTLDEEIDAELGFHVEQRIEQLVTDGMKRGEAESRVRQQFGDIAAVHQVCRRQLQPVRRQEYLGELGRLLRHAIRSLRRAPAYSLTIILLVSLGLGLTTSVLGWYHAYLVKPLPYPGAERLMRVDRSAPGTEGVPGAPEVPGGLNSIPWPAQDRLIEAMVAWEFDDFALLGGDVPDRVDGIWVTPGYFTALGIKPAVGRTFSQQDVDQGGDVVVLGYRLWQRRFGSDRGIVGGRISAYATDRPDEATSFTVIGVLPESYWSLTGEPDLLLPMKGTRRPSMVLAAPGVSPAQLADHLTVYARDHLATDPAWHMHVEPAQDAYVRQVRPALTLLLLTGIVVLAIVAGNVMVLVLVRAIRREREVAVRRALGASEGRVMVGWLAEAVVLMVPAAVTALVLAYVVYRFSAGAVERYFQVAVPGGAVAGFSLPVAAMTLAGAALIAGLIAVVPVAAGVARRLSPASAMEGSRTGGDTRSRSLIRHGVVVIEVALSLVLLLAGGLMVRSAMGLERANLGFEPATVLRAYVSLHPSRYPEADDQRMFYQTLLERVTSLPGVSDAALVDAFPFQVQRGSRLEAADQQAQSLAGIRAVTQVASADYFATMGIALRKGRISSGDGPLEVVVSQRLADLVWPGEDPLGQRLRLGTWRRLGNQDEPWRVVVGVVDDVAKTLTAENWPDVYIPFAQAVRPDMYLMVRSERDHATLGRALRTLAAELDPALPLSDIETMTRVIDRELARPRFLALLVACYAMLAVGLALSGLFGTLAFTVAQRRREIAVRMAVGADGRRVVGWLVGQGSRLVIGGVVLGVVASLMLNRLLASQLHGVHATDPLTFVVLVPALIGAALLATWLPARGAAKVEPVEVLRGE